MREGFVVARMPSILQCRAMSPLRVASATLAASLVAAIAAAQTFPTAVQRAFTEPVTVLQQSGDPANRLDIAIMGDGYTASEVNKSAADAELAGRRQHGDAAMDDLSGRGLLIRSRRARPRGSAIS
jgi:IgA peptidase M64